MNVINAKPTFIGIGAQKCASSWLYRVLQEHPEVAVSEQKELDFFSFRFDRGYQWYEQHFESAGQQDIRGEISPSYLCEESVPRRVAEYYPDMKIIVSFRDPIERALSNHRHEVRLGHISVENNNFEAGLKNNPMYIEQGLYATHLKRWLEHFPQQQIFVVLMQDIENDPQAVVKRLYSFVGVDESFRPESISARYNVSFANRSQSFRKMKDLAYGVSKTPGLRWTWSMGKALGLRSMYRKVNRVSSSEVISAPGLATLDAMRLRFEPEVRELSQIIDRSLDSWL